ncbi:MAG: DUF1329 domain-containing protein [Pseudomonadales bacterium]|nr:DUF1329 domain-containing protein [Pseudomonadales bacterium]
MPGSTDYVDPYADESPLYTITGKNWRDHADYLTVGTQAMFEKYGADGWEMHVYPSHRGAIRPDWFYANTARNATGARLVEDGQKIVGNYPGCPSPFPSPGWRPSGTIWCATASTRPSTTIPTTWTPAARQSSPHQPTRARFSPCSGSPTRKWATRS